MTRSITTEKIYDLINDVRRELKADITAVDTKVDNLVSQVGGVKVEQASISTRVYMIFGVVTLVISTVATAVMNGVMEVFKGR